MRNERGLDRREKYYKIAKIEGKEWEELAQTDIGKEDIIQRLKKLGCTEKNIEAFLILLSSIKGERLSELGKKMTKPITHPPFKQHIENVIWRLHHRDNPNSSRRKKY